MKKTTLCKVLIFLAICGFIWAGFSSSINYARAVSFSPGIQVGDEIVYDIFDQNDVNTTLIKHEITDIYEQVEGVINIDGTVFKSQNGSTYNMWEENVTLGILCEYEYDVFERIETAAYLVYNYLFYYPMGTKLRDYRRIFKDVTPSNYEYKYINGGYGFELTTPTYTAIRIINENGIVERAYFADYGTVDYEYTLNSINGEPYISTLPKYAIPGYSVALLLIFSVIGLVAVYYSHRAKILRSIRDKK